MFNLKKIFSAAAAAALTVSAEAVPCRAAEDDFPPYEPMYYVVGDADGDYAVNADDASLILKHYAAVSSGKTDDWTEQLEENCDIDGDGAVNAADASYVLGYYAYTSTLSEDGEYMQIRTHAKLSGMNYVLAPEGLDPGTPGTIKYIVNTAERNPHNQIPLYNIKEDNANKGVPYFVRNYTVTPEDKVIMEEFAKEHFTETMTNYDRLEYTWRWLHENITYADGRDGRPTYMEIYNYSFVEACFVKKAGQCIQYNGAFAMMMAYMGYDSYMLEQWNHPETLSTQHFATEAVINGIHYSTEVGEKSYDSPPNYYWMWLFNESKARFHGLPDEPTE